jgi:hypothetical protein
MPIDSSEPVAVDGRNHPLSAIDEQFVDAGNPGPTANPIRSVWVRADKM